MHEKQRIVIYDRLCYLITTQPKNATDLLEVATRLQDATNFSISSSPKKCVKTRLVKACDLQTCYTELVGITRKHVCGYQASTINLQQARGQRTCCNLRIFLLCIVAGSIIKHLAKSVIFA